jgi:hypothetical protein
MANEPFTAELATYDHHREELICASEGKFVLIRGEEIAGVWDTYADALEAGYEKYGLSPFLVKQVRGIEQVQVFTRGIVPCRS